MEICICSECRQPWNSIWVKTSLRIISAPGNLVALVRNSFRDFEQGKFWEVKKGGKGKCEVNWAYRAGITLGCLSLFALKKGCFYWTSVALFSFFLLFPYFHYSSAFSRLQSLVLHVHHLLKLPTLSFFFLISSFLELLLFNFTCSFIYCFFFWDLLEFCLLFVCLGFFSPLTTDAFSVG